MTHQRIEPEDDMDPNTTHELFSAAGRTLTSSPDAHPFIASVALARGEVYHRLHHSNVLDEGHGLRATLNDLEAALAELPARLIACISNGDDESNRVYLCGDKHSIVSVCHSGESVHHCTAHLIGDYLRDCWRDIVRRFQHKPRARKEHGSYLCVLARGMNGYGLSHCGVERSRLLDSNYAPATLAAMQSAARQLAAKEPVGRLLLLEGAPGTGKTRAVRALVAGLCDRARVVIVPPHLIAGLAGPDLIGTLLGCDRPTVLVIEDADYALLDRENRSDADKQGATGALSAMLNLTDGILGAQIDLRVIATTNARIDHLDAAVLRPGRLLDRISFGHLDPAQAQACAAHELRAEIKRGSVDPGILHAQLLAPMTLAEVYAWANAVRGQAAAKRDPQPANEAA